MAFSLYNFRKQNPEYADWDTDDLVGELYRDNPELKEKGFDINSFAMSVGADEDRAEQTKNREAERIADAPKRGVLGELGAEVARGFRRGISSGLKASRAFLPESIEPSREYIADVDEEFTDPDYAYRKGQDPVPEATHHQVREERCQGSRGFSRHSCC